MIHQRSVRIKRGFKLVEMLLVMAIIGILSGLFVPRSSVGHAVKSLQWTRSTCIASIALGSQETLNENS